MGKSKSPTKPSTKLVAIRHSYRLLHGTLKPVATRHSYKVHCYTALLLNLLLHVNIFTKSQTIYKSPNTILATISKSPILFWQPFLKAHYYFGNYLQKSSNTSLAKFYKYSKAQVLSLAIF